MTKDEIINMSAGQKMDELVAEKVMGWHKITDKNNYSYWGDDNGHFMSGVSRPEEYEDGEDYHLLRWHPSGSMLWAWWVIEKMNSDGYYLTLFNGMLGMWACTITRDATPVVGKHKPCLDNSAPLVICRASLLAKVE